MLPRSRSLFVLLPLVAFIAGASLMAYGRWTRPLLDAATAIDARDPERALNAYAASAERFRKVSVARQLFPRDFALVAHNRLALMYQRQDYDGLIAAADGAPPEAAPHYWIGCALFAKSRLEEENEPKLEWLSRAEEEFKLALKDMPDDWDTKYNYELSVRLAAALRNQPKSGRQSQTSPTSLMQLLRPTPSPRQDRPVKKVG